LAGDWRGLHSEELQNIYASTDTLRMIKSRRMRWAGLGARMGDIGMYRKFLSENLK
jgi:hypothetical protein